MAVLLTERFAGLSGHSDRQFFSSRALRDPERARLDHPLILILIIVLAIFFIPQPSFLIPIQSHRRRHDLAPCHQFIELRTPLHLVRIWRR
jgi:hypothetical protein